MSYEYSNGEGLSALDPTRPDGQTEQIAILDDAIRQIKQYLADPVAGPDALARGAVPVGTVLVWSGLSAPAGYLICNGQAVTQAEYPALYDMLVSSGNLYGVDGVNPRVPDLRRRVPVGAGGAGSGELASSVGATGGEEEHKLTVAEMPKHRHDSAEYTPATGAVGPHVITLGQPTPTQTYSSNYNLIAEAGGDEPHNNLQPSIVLNYIIRAA